MKRLTAILLCLLLAAVASAQEATPVDDFRALYVTLSNKYVKNPDDVANLIDLARFHSCTDSPQFNLPLANQYLTRAETLYTEWLQDRGRYRDLQKLIRQGITLSLIRQQHQSLDEQALHYVRSHAPAMGQVERTAFMDAFGRSNQVASALRASQLDDDYRRTRAENTVNALYRFLLAHPGIALADSVEGAIGSLAATLFSSMGSTAAIDSVADRYPSSPALQRAAMRQKSRMAYADACQTNTEAAYSAYLEQFPRGDNYLEALARLQALRAMDYGLLRTPQDYADFAEAFSDDPLADSALACLRLMITRDHNRQAADIYLSRFPLDEHYNEIYKLFYSWFADDGNRQPIQSFADDNPDYPYFMAVLSDLARSEVIDSFDLTKPFVESDMPRMTDCVRLCTGRKAAFVALQRVLQGQIARKEWAKAQIRMQDFAICFEDLNTAEYNELAALLAAKGTPSRSLLFSHGSLRHPFVSPDGDRLYFSHPSGTVAFARRAARNQGWHYAGAVTVQGAAAAVTAFGFFDGGNSVLLGIGGDIWTARVVNDTLWTDLQRLPQPVNTPFVETDASMLPDGSGILLASDRPGGHNVQQSGAYFHGDTALATDLYYIPLADGKWGEPVNLGLPVNSPYCERSPLLSRNMRTLYFVTDARGLGYGDVYMTTRTSLADWCHWSQPVNLGKGVNGSFNEASIAFAHGERQLIVASSSPGGTAYAAYAAPTAHDTASGHRTVGLLLGDLVDVANGLDVIDVSQSRVALHLPDSALDSLQPLRLYQGMPYVALLSADWLYVPAVAIAPAARGLIALQGYDLDTLRRLGRPLPLALVAFHPGTARLLPVAQLELDNLARFMLQRTGCKVKLSVHVDGQDDRQCYDLSLARAQSLRNYLVSQGVARSRIAIAAYGNLQFKQGNTPAAAEVRFQ